VKLIATLANSDRSLFVAELSELTINLTVLQQVVSSFRSSVIFIDTPCQYQKYQIILFIL
jgi:hypothetical protein